MNHENFPIKDTYLYNPYELASHLENVMGRYFISIEEVCSNVNQFLTGFPVARILPVVPAMHLRHPPRERPRIPYIGMAIVRAFIERVVEDSAEWSRRTTPSFEETMEPFLKPQWRQTEEVYEHLRGMMIDCRTDIKVFLGHDHWIMHFVRVRGFDIYIEKSIDYRIYDWTRRKQAGEF